jgi:SAM-dependent methyltransferase
MIILKQKENIIKKFEILENILKFNLCIGNMVKQLLYRDLAKYYDKLYHFKNYKKESEALIKLISKNIKIKGKDLLEVGCGTGHHMQYLKKKYICFGTDINKEILDLAKKKHKNVKFKKADMINMKLSKKFDVIISMFSAIGYVKTLSNLKKTIMNFSKHLNVGGVVIIEPWFTSDVYKKGTPYMTVYEDDDLKIARLNTNEVKNNVSIMDMHYLIAEKGKKVKHFVDRHELGLFEIKDTLEIMKSAGLKSKFLKHGFLKNRGVYVGIKE